MQTTRWSFCTVSRTNMNFNKDILLDPNNIIIGHNIKFDIKKLEQHFKIKHKAKLYDTYIIHSLLDENSNDNELKQLTATYTSLGHYEDNNSEMVTIENSENPSPFGLFNGVVPQQCSDK